MGTTSNTRVKQKNVAQYKSAAKLEDLSEYDQFCHVLSSADGRTLNPSNFMDYIAILVSIYTGTDQTVSIQKWSANNHCDDRVLAITSLDSLIPCIGPRDKISYQNPDFSRIQSILPQIMDDTDDVQSDEDQKEDSLDKTTDVEDGSTNIDMSSMTTSYAFAAFPDQRLFADGKCSPYILDDNFRWTIVHGTGVCPSRIEHRVAGYTKVRAAGLFIILNCNACIQVYNCIQLLYSCH